jgi:hypothetical protein
MADQDGPDPRGAASPPPGQPASPLINMGPDPPQQAPPQSPHGDPNAANAKQATPPVSPKQADAGDAQNKFRFGAGVNPQDGTAAFTTPGRTSPFSPGGAKADKTPAMKPKNLEKDLQGTPQPDGTSVRKSLYRRRTGSTSDMIIEGIATKQQILQQGVLVGLIAYIKQDPSKIFNSTRIITTEYQGPSDQRAYRLFQFFYELYRYGFQQFDEQTHEIFQTYLTYCARVFDEVAHPEDKETFSTQARFLAIAICFGIDRALTGLKYKDKLFREFQHVTYDNYHTEIYDKHELVQKVPELPAARDLYLDFFRNDQFDPILNNKVPMLDPLGVSYAEVTHHGFSTPVNLPRVPQISPFFKQLTPDTGERFNYPSPQENHSTRPRSSMRNPGNCNPNSDSDQDQNGSYRAYGRGQDQHLSDSDQDYVNACIQMTPPSRPRATGKSENVHQSRPQSRQRFSDTVQRNIYTPESDIASNEDSDSAISDPFQPKVPLHQQSTTGTHGKFFGDRISSAGRVYDSSRSRIRKPPRKSGFINNIAQDLSNLELDDQQRAAVLGTSLGIAHSINAFTKEGQRQQRDTIKVLPAPPDDIDLRVDSFDYNRDGTTAEEILGRRFSRLSFPSEAARLSTLRSIFSRVVDDPASSNVARHIALNQLGQFDHPKLTKQEVEHYISRSISRLDTHLDPEIIPPPILGDNALDGKTYKTLQTRLGLGPSDRFSFDELNPGLLKNVLNNVSAVITNSGLREEEAYALLRRMTTGITYDTIQLAEFEQKIPFSEYWLIIQKTQKRTSSARDHEKRLKQILNSDKVENLEKTLNEIMVCTFKIHENETDPAYRKLITQRECLKNLRTFIRRHYSPYFSQINTCFMDRLRQVALEKNDSTFTNENTFHHQKVQIYLEIACEILAKYEPEEYQAPRPSHQRSNTYIHAMGGQDQQPNKNAPQQQQTQEQQRPPSRFNQRSNTPGPRNQDRNQQYNSQQQRPQTPGRRRPTYTCFLCNIQGHSYRECKKYPGMQPSQNGHCQQCGGAHHGECRSRRARAQTPGPGAQTQVAALDAAPAQQQPIGQATPPFWTSVPPNQYGNQNPNYQQNNYRPPSRDYYQQDRRYNNGPRQNYQQNHQQNCQNSGPRQYYNNDRQGRPPSRFNDQREFQNNQGYFRNQSRNDNRQRYNNDRDDGRQSQNGFRNFRPRSQSGYRNNDRRSQSGYRDNRNNDRRNYNGNRYNGNNSNFTPLGQRPRYENRQYDRNNGYNSGPPRQYDQRQNDPDQGRTTPFFKSSYYGQQQQNAPQPPKEQQQPTVNGIGNTGFQQVPLAARLSAMAAEDSSYPALGSESFSQ